MPVRCTSADAYRKLNDSGRAEHTTALIVAVLKRHPKGLTRRELESETGLRPNQISGRVRELLDRKTVVEGAKRRCSLTGNVVNVVMLGEGE